MLERDDEAALLGIVGAAGLLPTATERLPYETAARYGSGRAAAVVRPANTSQVSAVLRHCVARGLPYVPQSGNTGLVLGGTPDGSGRQIVISLDRLRAPPQIAAADRTARVAAGVRLSALNAALEPHELFLPIDLGADPMIGGMIATNTGGARYLRYGDVRRRVLGLEVVLPDAAGTVLDLEGALRKDNAHLDLRQLFIGSCGAFGIITSATLEVVPRPRHTAAALLVPRDEDAVLELLTAFEAEAGDLLTAFEGMSGAALHHAFAHIPALRNPFPDGLPAYVVLIELSSPARRGGESLDSVLESIVTGLAEQFHAPLTDVRFGRPESLWAVRHALSEGLRAAGPVVGFDLSFRRSQVMAFRRVAMAQLEAAFAEFEVCDFGHVGDGGVHFNLLQRSTVTPERLAAVRDRVLDLAVREFGASFSGEHGIGRANQGAYDRYIPVNVQHYSAAIAALFARLPAAGVRFGPLRSVGEPRDDDR